MPGEITIVLFPLLPVLAQAWPKVELPSQLETTTTCCCDLYLIIPPVQPAQGIVVPSLRWKPPAPVPLLEHCTPPSTVELRQFQICPVSAISSNWSRMTMEPTCRLPIAPFAGLVVPQLAKLIVVVPAAYPEVQSQSFCSASFTSLSWVGSSDTTEL